LIFIEETFGVMQRERILIIEDEDIILRLSKDILAKENYEVRTISNGYEGVKLLEKQRFDLLLTDIKMPDIDGLEVIRHVRTNNKEIPIIIITAHGTLDIAIHALRLGAQGFLLKPFAPAEMRSAVSEALEKTKLLQENIRMRALMPLFEVSKEIISEIDSQRLLKLILDIAVKETRADIGYIFLMDEVSGKVGMKAEHGLSPDFLINEKERYGERIWQFMLKGNKLLHIISGVEVPHALEELRKTEKAFCSIYMPLTIRGKIIGILYIGRTSGNHPFSLSQVELVSVLGGQAAASIENARLYEKLQQSYLSMIVTLSGVVEARDYDTDKHMKDIAEYSVEIAQKLKLSSDEIEDIRKAALLHDLGKICVPDNILMKAGKLSEAEMDVIRKHPEHGAKIIESVEQIKYAREIIKHHHEHFNGEGYPDCLKGTEIPLGSRIISVADAFGAMTTNRPYRKALSLDKAMEELKTFSGTQFDPAIVEVFISILREKGVLNGSGEDILS
jgi:putative nucleotidyltransferase with HDIG domain